MVIKLVILWRSTRSMACDMSMEMPDLWELLIPLLFKSKTRGILESINQVVSAKKSIYSKNWNLVVLKNNCPKDILNSCWFIRLLSAFIRTIANFLSFLTRFTKRRQCKTWRLWQRNLIRNTIRTIADQ